MRNITPYEVGTTGEAGKYIVWGKGIGGKIYHTYVLDPSGRSTLTLGSIENLKHLAIDNDDWTLFEGDLYHGDKSPIGTCALCGSAISADGGCGCMPATNADDQAAAAVRQLQSNAAGRLVISILDMLNDHCAKQEALHQAAADSEGAKRWWAARVHIEHCSNLVEMIKL